VKSELLFGFGKIFHEPIAPLDVDSYFDKAEAHFLNTH
jgi:hypothetical protein